MLEQQYSDYIKLVLGHLYKESTVNVSEYGQKIFWSYFFIFLEKKKTYIIDNFIDLLCLRISDYMDLTPVDIVGKRCYQFIHAEDVEGIRQSHLDCEYTWIHTTHWLDDQVHSQIVTGDDSRCAQLLLEWVGWTDGMNSVVFPHITFQSHDLLLDCCWSCYVAFWDVSLLFEEWRISLVVRLNVFRTSQSTSIRFCFDLRWLIRGETDLCPHSTFCSGQPDGEVGLNLKF